MLCDNTTIVRCQHNVTVQRITAAGVPGRWGYLCRRELGRHEVIVAGARTSVVRLVPPQRHSDAPAAKRCRKGQPRQRPRLLTAEHSV
jgi:hypothetical protein